MHWINFSAEQRSGTYRAPDTGVTLYGDASMASLGIFPFGIHQRQRHKPRQRLKRCVMSWGEGYVSEIDYTPGYYREISPSALHLSTLAAGLKTRLGRPVRYLELGFGQGLSLNVHAAACEDEFWGVDFNPTHAAYARELAAMSGAKVTILEKSFAEVAAQDDLPDFDVIVLHGIWTWVSLENRQAIETIIRKKLVAGGLVYVSYNTLPGWAAAAPLQHLMTSYAALSESGNKNIRTRIDDSIAFSKTVATAGAAYFTANPSAAARLESFTNQDRRYLAHEFFNQDWQPVTFQSVSQQLASAKLEFVCDSNTIIQLYSIFLPEPAKELVKTIQNPSLLETVKDYLLNVQFRKDIYVKGRRNFLAVEQAEKFLDLSFVLLVASDAVTFKLNGPAGEVTLQEDVYRALVDVLAADHYAPKRVRDILADPLWGGRNLATLSQALVLLAGSDQVHIAQDASVIEAVRPRCDALNTHLSSRARFGDNSLVLASPVTGGGVPVGRFEQMFLASRKAGTKTPAEWAKDVWTAISALDQRLLQDGQPIESADDNLKELTAQAETFNDKRLPLLQALGVA